VTDHAIDPQDPTEQPEDRATDPAADDAAGPDEPRRRRRRGRRGRGRGRRSGEGDGTGASASDGDTSGSDGDSDASGGDAGASAGDASERPPQAATAEGATRSGSSRSSSSRGTSSRGTSSRGAASRGGSSRTERSRSRSGRSSTAGADAQEAAEEPRTERGGRGSTEGGRREEASGEAGGRSGGDEQDVEDAIAKGGTRMAAKRSGRRSGGGNGGGRRGTQRTGGVPEEVRRAILEGPPRTMLVTAREDRTQIAVLEDRTVVEHYVTRRKDVTYVGNIYMARVQNVLPGMEAAFLDIGKGRNGVLYAGEVLYDELDLEEGDAHRIENALKPGQTVLVQVTKDPMGSKGPRLTMHLSLAGRYMVLAPSSDLFGISRKLTDKERDRLRRVVKKVKPEQHGIIVRTAAEGASEEQITADIERLLAKWARVEEAAAGAKALSAVYEEPPLVVKVIRDNFGPEFERAIVDDEDLYRQVRGYLDEVAPELLDKVELYGAPTSDARARAAGAPPLEAGSEPAPEAAVDTPDGGAAEPDATPGEATTEDAGAGTPDVDVEEARGGPAGAQAPEVEAPDPLLGAVDLAAAAARRAELPPLFEAYDVADQLRKAMGRKVWLPSGGYLIIESTEAMKVIDVNTGRFTGGKDTNLEEIVLRTNLEAADEIVRQLRLRDMGGIIVIDFIDMLLKANQEQVVRRLKRELLRDRTKTRVSEVSRLGLVQMTRKNVSQGLVESFSHPCEACEGRGVISELE
jgi:Ribonuclease G/E